MRLPIPFGFHDEIAYLHNAIPGEGIAKVLKGWRIEFVCLAVGMQVVETGELGVIAANAVGRGLQQSSALGIVFKHRGMKGFFCRGFILLATTCQEGHRSKEQTRKSPADATICRVQQGCGGSLVSGICRYVI